MSTNLFFQTVKQAITESSENGSIADSGGVLTGFSGEKMVGTLQRLSQQLLDEHTVYLEVGVYQGLTLLSVAQVIGDRLAYGIDNFAYFDKKGVNYGIVQERIQRLHLSNAHIINQDYEDALENLASALGGKKVGVYFIDGPHDYRSQLMCLALMKPFLAENAVIIVDDCNYRHVRQANRDFLITHPEYKLLFESYTPCHPLNAGATDRGKLEKSWWNGVNIIVTDPKNELEPFYPETFRDRSLYENEHGLHTTKHPEVIPFLLKLTDKLAPAVYRFSKLKNKPNRIVGKFAEMNTYSENLPKDKFHPSLQ